MKKSIATIAFIRTISWHFDLLNNRKDYISHYSEEDKAQFGQYLQQQIDKIDLPNKDESFLRERLLEMYANPAKNQLAVS